MKTFKLGCSCWGDTIEKRIESIKVLADTGFETIMLPAFLDDPEGCAKVVQAVRDAGMTVDEIHAPFNNINYMWYDDPSGDPILEMLKSSVDRCVDMQVDTMVLHDNSGRIGPDTSNAGLARFRELFIYAKEKGVRPAVENLRRTNHTARNFHENRDLPVYYCWDSGHECCYTPGVDHVALFPEKLVCTHIHDNSGVYMMDDHWLPFDGATNWERKAHFIRKSGYTGALTMELAREQAKYADMSDKEFAAEAYKRIIRFAEMCK